MRSRVRSLSLALCALLWGAAPAAGAAELRVGFGRAEFPRPENGPLAGYGGWRDRRAREVLDPPEARALMISGADVRIALVVLDLVIIRPSLREGLRELSRSFAIDELVVAATHTHSGPGGYIPGRVAARLTSGRFDPGTPRKLIHAARRALRLALEDLTPARVASGRTELSLARNRRFSEGPHETELPLLRFDFPSGRAPIVLFAYGAHPTVLSPRSHAYSADYVGAARTWLQQQGWRAIFVAGPLGDQEPISQQGPLWPRDLALQRSQMIEIGNSLGKAVLEGVRKLIPGDGAELAAFARWIELPTAPRFRRFCSTWWLSPFLKSNLRGFLSKRAPMHAIRVGGARIVTVPAEPSSAIGRGIREGLASGQPLFVVAHASDWLGYVVSPEAYRRGGYEPCMSFYGSDLGPWLIEEAIATGRLLDLPPLSSNRSTR